MLRIYNHDVSGLMLAIHGMRNPRMSHSDMDTIVDSSISGGVIIGPKDMDLMKRLINAGPEHCKFRRFIHAQMVITAPLYWWKEFDAYKIGVTTNSASSIDTVYRKKFDMKDFSTEYMNYEYSDCTTQSRTIKTDIIDHLNELRDILLKIPRENPTARKSVMDDILQLIPSSWNQFRTVDLTYETLANQYRQRSNHPMNEWHEYLEYIENNLQYAKELVCVD